MKRFIDRALSKLGLVRKSQYDAMVEGSNKFLRCLGDSAKAAGVKVLLDDQYISNLELDSDIFILGSRNVITGCSIQGGKILVAPVSCSNLISGNIFLP